MPQNEHVVILGYVLATHCDWASSNPYVSLDGVLEYPSAGIRPFGCPLAYECAACIPGILRLYILFMLSVNGQRRQVFPIWVRCLSGLRLHTPGGRGCSCGGPGLVTRQDYATE